MSTTRESKPWCAITSAEKLDGIDSHPLTTTPPFAQIDFTVFSRPAELLPELAQPGPPTAEGFRREDRAAGRLAGSRHRVSIGARRVSRHPAAVARTMAELATGG